MSMVFEVTAYSREHAKIWGPERFEGKAPELIDLLSRRIGPTDRAFVEWDEPSLLGQGKMRRVMRCFFGGDGRFKAVPVR